MYEEVGEGLGGARPLHLSHQQKLYSYLNLTTTHYYSLIMFSSSSDRQVACQVLHLQRQ